MRGSTDIIEPHNCKTSRVACAPADDQDHPWRTEPVNSVWPLSARNRNALQWRFARGSLVDVFVILTGYMYM